MTRQRSLKVRILGAATLFLAVLTVLMAFAAPALGKRAASAVPDPGNPLFLPAVAYGTGGYLAWSIAVGDVNVDGTPDLVVANDFGTVGVLLGNGDGTFESALGYSSGGGSALSVVIADINGDHKPDLIVANAGGGSSAPGNTVAVLLGNGDGTFQPAVTYGSGGYSAVSGELISISMVVADVNGDSRPDLVVGNDCAVKDNDCTQGTVGVLLGNGDGTFRPTVAYQSGGYFAGTVAVADLNGDSKPDVVVTNCASVGSGNCSGNGVVGVLLGNGDGTFHAVKKYSSGSADSFMYPVVVADVNGDGKPDLLIANAGAGNGNATGSAGVLLGNGDGTFRPVTAYGSGGNSAVSIAVADMNADGKADLVLANLSGSIGVLSGNGDGTFQPVQSYSAGGGDSFVALVADVNSDGIPDVVVAAWCDTEICYPGWVDVLLGNGDGTLQAAQTYLSGGFLPSDLAVADVNGDGKPDLLVTNWCASQDTCGVGETGVVGVLLNNTAICTTPPIVTLSATPRSLWPPNGTVVRATVSGTITDSSTGCTVKTAAYAVTDEYGRVQPSGALTLAAGGAYSFTVLLQASRLGTDLDGRHYTITVSASNNAGMTGSQAGSVIVPHDQAH